MTDPRPSLPLIILLVVVASLFSGCAYFDQSDPGADNTAAMAAARARQQQWDTRDLEPDHLALARDLADKEFYDVALVQLKKAIEEKGGNALVYDLAGVCARETGDFKASESFLKKAAAIDPENASVRNNMGILYAALGENDRAEQAFQKAVSLDPGRADFLNNLGYLHLTQKKYPEAQSAFAKSLVLKPAYEPALNNLIVCLGMQRKDAEVMDLLMKHFDTETAWYNMACIYTLRKEHMKAQKLLRFVRTGNGTGEKTAFEIQALPPDTRGMPSAPDGLPGDVASTIYTDGYMPAMKK